MESSLAPFRPDDVERARRYHRPLYVALLLDATLGLAVLSALAFTRAGSWLHAVVDELPWWGRALAFPPLVLGVLTLVRLPLSFWRGHIRERRWGFSTQTAWSWLLDRAKGFAVGAVLSALAVLGLVALVRALRARGPRPPRRARRCSSSRSLSPGRSRLSPFSTASRRYRTRRSKASCVGSQNGQACPFGMCSSPTRAGGRARRTPTSRASALPGASFCSTPCSATVSRVRSGSSSRTSSATVARGTWRRRRSWRWPARPRSSSSSGGSSRGPRSSRRSAPPAPVTRARRRSFSSSASCSSSSRCRSGRRSRGAGSAKPTGSRSSSRATRKRSRARIAGSQWRTSPTSTRPPAAYALLSSHPTPPERISVARAWARIAETRTART